MSTGKHQLHVTILFSVPKVVILVATICSLYKAETDFCEAV